MPDYCQKNKNKKYDDTHKFYKMVAGVLFKINTAVKKSIY